MFAHNFTFYYRLNLSFKTFTTNISIVSIPKLYRKHFPLPKWRKMIQEEMQALDKNDTWELVSIPFGKRSVGCECVLM